MSSKAGPEERASIPNHGGPETELPPEGSPNVVIVLLDDIGNRRGVVWAVVGGELVQGRPDLSPTPSSASEKGLEPAATIDEISDRS